MPCWANCHSNCCTHRTFRRSAVLLLSCSMQMSSSSCFSSPSDYSQTSFRSPMTITCGPWASNDAAIAALNASANVGTLGCCVIFFISRSWFLSQFDFLTVRLFLWSSAVNPRALARAEFLDISEEILVILGLGPCLFFVHVHHLLLFGFVLLVSGLFRVLTLPAA